MTSIKFQYEEDCRRRSIENVTFQILVEHIKESFPFFNTQNYQLRYKDDEEMWITVSTDGDLVEALSLAKERKKILTLVICKRQQQQQQPTHSLATATTRAQPEEEVIHPGIICDGCNSDMKGIRYKCTVCPDFDLCSLCETKKEHNASHPFLKIQKTLGRHNNGGVMVRCIPSLEPPVSLTSCPLVRLTPATKLVPPPPEKHEPEQQQQQPKEQPQEENLIEPPKKEVEPAPLQVKEEVVEAPKKEEPIQAKEEPTTTSEVKEVKEEEEQDHQPLKTLRELGFLNEELNRKLLSENDHDLFRVIDILLAQA